MLSDELRVHEFHLLDVDWSFSTPPFVLFPSASFSAITAPEMTIETETIVEGTSDFVHNVLKKASVSGMTLQKGVTPFNSDFWRWTTACLKGTPTDPSYGLATLLADVALLAALQGSPPVPGKRRNLLLLHATGISPAGLLESMSSGSGLDLVKGLALLPATGVTAVAGGLSALTNGMIDVGITSIPGKVFMLFDCLPTRYKPASDFDASATQVSVEEMDIIFSRFEEFSIAG